MKNYLKNASLIALGLFIGFTANTYGALETINAYKDNVTSIFVKGVQIKSLNTPINYKGSLYVPLRTISENMGLDVNYDKSTKSIYITEKPLSKEEQIAKNAKIYEEALADAKKLQAKSVEEARLEDVKRQEQKIDYKALPVMFRQGKFKMTLKMIVNENADNNSEFYFDVKNEEEFGYVVDPFSAKLNYTIGNVDYEINSDDVYVTDMDKRILSSLDNDYDDTLFITLKQIPNDVHKATLSFNIYKVGEENKITKVIMPIEF